MACACAQSWLTPQPYTDSEVPAVRLAGWRTDLLLEVDERLLIDLQESVRGRSRSTTSVITAPRTTIMTIAVERAAPPGQARAIAEHAQRQGRPDDEQQQDRFGHAGIQAGRDPRLVQVDGVIEGFDVESRGRPSLAVVRARSSAVAQSCVLDLRRSERCVPEGPRGRWSTPAAMRTRGAAPGSRSPLALADSQPVGTWCRSNSPRRAPGHVGYRNGQTPCPW